MSWNNLIGLEREKKLLQKAILSGKIASAYLFYGSEGIGKKGMALEFAKSINCENPIIDNANALIDSCEECQSCKMMNNLSHPNLHLLFSLPSGKNAETKTENPLGRLDDKQIAELQSQIEKISANPYHRFLLQGAHTIKVDQIRDIKKKIALTSARKGKSFIIIFNAEEMTRESANAFLKTLEEPNENIHIILVTSHKDALLDTILSRTQLFFFHTPTIEEIKHGLIEKFKLEANKAQVIAALSNGSVTAALEQLEKEFVDLRSELVDILRIALRKKNYRIDLIDRIDKLIKENDSREIITALLLFEIWFRDALFYSKSNDILKIINLDMKDVIEKFVININNFDYSEAIKLIEKSINLIKKNVNIQLILVNLYLGLRTHLHKFY